MAELSNCSIVDNPGSRFECGMTCGAVGWARAHARNPTCNFDRAYAEQISKNSSVVSASHSFRSINF